MPFDKEGRFRPTTPREEVQSGLMNAWINLVQGKEYDRIVRYILKRTDEGKGSIVGDILTGSKHLVINIRRGSAVAGGVIVGLAALRLTATET